MPKSQRLGTFGQQDQHHVPTWRSLLRESVSGGEIQLRCDGLRRRKKMDCAVGRIRCEGQVFRVRTM